MATISAAMVKELREKTGAGMMDCKAALKENDGDMEAAVDWLRAKGLAKAAKKAGRVAAEGLIGLAENGSEAALVEVNSETDFVARNPSFQEMVGAVSSSALKAKGNLEKLGAEAYGGGSASVAGLPIYPPTAASSQAICITNRVLASARSASLLPSNPQAMRRL